MSGSSRTAGTRTAKPSFSVFTDSSAVSATNTSSKQGSTATTKRVKVASSSTRPLQVLGSKNALLSTEDKENEDPSGRRAGKQVSKGASSALSSKPVNSTSANIPASVKTGKPLWSGKTPFEAASPESCTCAKAASKATTIYDLPGTDTISSHRATSSLANGSSLRAAAPRSRNVAGGAVSRPNKKIAASKPVASFQIFKDEVQDKPQMLESPAMRRIADRARDAGAANRKVRELTESPLAEVTQAYTGRGRFSNCPAGDSGFGGSAHASREPSTSPLPIRSLSQKDLQNLQLVLETETPASLDSIAELPLPQYRDSSIISSPKRRFSQVSIARDDEEFDAELDIPSQMADQDNGEDEIVTPRVLTLTEEKHNPFTFNLSQVETPKTSSHGLQRRMAGLRV